LTRVVVDASVLIAGLFKDGTVRDLLLNSEEMGFTAPAYLKEEALRHVAEVASRAKLPPATVSALLEDLLGSIDLIQPGAYAACVGPATELAKEANARGDEEYIALALALRAPIWTLDRDFRRIPGLRVLTSKEVEKISKTGDES
jgi:predicted nucleic acid-binding protein